MSLLKGPDTTSTRMGNVLANRAGYYIFKMVSVLGNRAGDYIFFRMGSILAIRAGRTRTINLPAELKRISNNRQLGRVSKSGVHSTHVPRIMFLVYTKFWLLNAKLQK